MHRNHIATENCPALDDEAVMSTIENSPVNQDRYGHTTLAW